MNPFRSPLLSLLLLCLAITSPAFAAPKVVVTQPAIHSLLTSLMEGVDHPQLLMEKPEDANRPLDPFQTAHLLTADLIIWIGAGLEGNVEKTLQRFPMIRQHTATLSLTIPLLLKKDYDGIATDRQLSRELTFWNDPKLAMMAVKQITPTLVRLDPEHTERYLDNEIALLQHLKQTQSEIVERLSSLPALPEGFSAGFDRYFAHRFLPTNPTTAADTTMRKVSTDAKPFCTSSDTSHLRKGMAFYFDSIMAQAQDVITCAGKLDTGRQMADHKPLSPTAG
ncbi:MAG: metal ABC transporter substrate-binding protein [Candidatus Thiodiazotropha sp.]